VRRSAPAERIHLAYASPMARILIAGCGYVGTALGELLRAEGHDVVGVRRDPSGLPPGIEPLAFDLASGQPLVLPDPVDFAVYCVGAKASSEEAYRAAYLQGLETTLAALERQSPPPQRVFFTSSTSVYAQQAGEWLDEESPTQPERFSGRILLEAEARLAASTLPSTVLRLGGIYGPGRTRLLERVAAGDGAPAAGPPLYTNRIHRDDAAGALHCLMFGLPTGGATAPLYLGVDCEPATQHEVYVFLAAALGVPAPAARNGEAAPEPRRAGSKRCSNARLLSAGYAFRYPTFREGYAELAAAYASARAAR
jgi:nucleoside-diphosphate-sugar epimerase